MITHREKKKKEQEQVGKQYGLWENIHYMMKGLMRYDRVLIVLIFFGALTMTSMWYLWTFISKFVIAMIETSIAGGTQSLTPLFHLILIVLGLEVGLMSCNVVAENYLDYHITYVRMKFTQERIAKTLSMDYEMLENPKILDLMKKAEKATDEGRVGIKGMLIRMQRFLQMTACLLVGVAIISTLNPFLVCVAVLIGFFQSLYYKYTVKIEKQLTWDLMGPILKKQGYLNDVARDFSYAKDIRLFSFQKLLLKKQRNVNQQQLELTIQAKNQWIKNAFVSQFLTILLNGILYGYLVKAVLFDGLAIANFSFYILSAISFTLNVTNMLNSFSAFQTASEQVNDFRRFMELEDISNQKTCIPLPKMKDYEFQFEQVSFSYPGTDKFMLQNINLTLKPGKRLAVVGLNGAGKSTFIKLLLRIYDVTQGRILLNGVDVRKYDKKEYFQLFSPVFQDVEIFAFPIRENISMSVTENTKEEVVEECIVRAGLQSKIQKLPEGSKTQLLKILHEDGIDLSGGEKQKLALARALYKNAPVVILDEPTSAMDALSENQLYMDFDKLIAGKTAVYISHRLSSTRFCDGVAMFEEGQIIEYGTHEELMKLEGAYATMFGVQAQYYIQQEEQVVTYEN